MFVFGKCSSACLDDLQFLPVLFMSVLTVMHAFIWQIQLFFIKSEFGLVDGACVQFSCQRVVARKPVVCPPWFCALVLGPLLARISREPLFATSWKAVQGHCAESKHCVIFAFEFFFFLTTRNMFFFFFKESVFKLFSYHLMILLSCFIQKKKNGKALNYMYFSG